MFSKIKFHKSETTHELIGFVSQNIVTKQLRGVPENAPYKKKICVLAEDLKGKVEEGVLYNVELKPMVRLKGFVVVKAERVLFPATVETIILRKVFYRIEVHFGKKIIYFDPIEGKTPSSRTIDGALEVLKSRGDVKNLDIVVQDFKRAAERLLLIMRADGYLV